MISKGISSITRKTLWAKSGNRCAICKIELVQSIDKLTENLIIGEECHIIAREKNGPRGEIKYNGDINDVNNLLLLCANDHKRIDDLTTIYTVDKLRAIKTEHEEWVKSSLEKNVLAFTNDKLNIKSLPRIKTGKELVDLIRLSSIYNFEHEELKTNDEAELIGGFFDELKDYSDIISELGNTEIAKLSIKYSEDLNNLQDNGFWVFGLNRPVNVLLNKMPNIFEATILYVIRKDNPSILGDFIIVQFPNKAKLSF